MIELNGMLVNYSQFPNGETCVNGQQIKNLIDTKDVNKVNFKYENDGDLIKLMFLKKHLDSMKVKTRLKIMYMPYSRMDRVEGSSVFTLKYVTEFINQLGFTEVIVFEPHSDVTPDLLDRCEPVYVTKHLIYEAMQIVGFDKDKDYLFLPDAGAAKRYTIKGYKHLKGDKRRNFVSGEIEGLDIIGEMEEGAKVIIMDDLCSFGGTFMRSAKKLKELGASEVYLVVTHCENSIHKGKIPTDDVIDGVFATDTIISESDCEKIHIIKIPKSIEKNLEGAA